MVKIFADKRPNLNGYLVPLDFEISRRPNDSSSKLSNIQTDHTLHFSSSTPRQRETNQLYLH